MGLRDSWNDPLQDHDPTDFYKNIEQQLEIISQALSFSTEKSFIVRHAGDELIVNINEAAGSYPLFYVAPYSNDSLVFFEPGTRGRNMNERLVVLTTNADFDINFRSFVEESYLTSEEKNDVLLSEIPLGTIADLKSWYGGSGAVPMPDIRTRIKALLDRISDDREITAGRPYIQDHAPGSFLILRTLSSRRDVILIVESLLENSEGALFILSPARIKIYSDMDLMREVDKAVTGFLDTPDQPCRSLLRYRAPQDVAGQRLSDREREEMRACDPVSYKLFFPDPG